VKTAGTTTISHSKSSVAFVSKVGAIVPCLFRQDVLLDKYSVTSQFIDSGNTLDADLCRGTDTALRLSRL
jgi:hypothetical protein